MPLRTTVPPHPGQSPYPTSFGLAPIHRPSLIPLRGPGLEPSQRSLWPSGYSNPLRPQRGRTGPLKPPSLASSTLGPSLFGTLTPP
ncbi:hypothetical protein FKM82_023689 [Ascaphus truei]